MKGVPVVVASHQGQTILPIVVALHQAHTEGLPIVVALHQGHTEGLPIVVALHQGHTEGLPIVVASHLCHTQLQDETTVEEESHLLQSHLSKQEEDVAADFVFGFISCMVTYIMFLFDGCISVCSFCLCIIL